MAAENTLILTFKNENGSLEKIKIKNVKDTIETLEVNNIGTAIITENVFYSNGGDLKSLEKAIVEKVSEEIIPLD